MFRGPGGDDDHGFHDCFGRLLLQNFALLLQSAPNSTLPVMLTRSEGKWVLSIQMLQLLDAFLVWFGFLLGSLLRNPMRELLHMPPLPGRSILSDMSWVLYISVPFTPLLLEYFGFYEQVGQKSRRRAILQIAKALAVVSLVLGLMSAFSRLQDASRLILAIGVPVIALLLLLRDRFSNWRESINGIEPQD